MAILRRHHTAILLLSLLAGACDDGPSQAPEAPPDEPTPPSPELVEAAGIEAPPSVWPEDSPDLSASLEAATDLESCRESLRDRMPVEVAEAMADIGYDRIVEDVCRGLLAVKEGSVEACDELSVSALQQGCRRRLALREGRPAACPDDPTLPGREPTCIAWAARDPGLCRAAGPADRARCRAVLAGRPALCNRLLPGDRERCRAEVRRYGPSLGDERVESPAADVEPSFTAEAEVTGRGPGTETVAIERDVLDRGIHLEAREPCRYRIELSEPGGERPPPVSFTDRPPVLTAVLEVPAVLETPHEVPLGPTGARLSLTLPGIGEGDSVTNADGKVTITEWSTERGGIVAGELEADLSLTPGTAHVEGAFRTFVRDVDPLPDACTPASESD